MTFFIQEQTPQTEGGTDTLKGLNDGLVVTLNRGSFIEIDTPTITKGGASLTGGKLFINYGPVV